MQNGVLESAPAAGRSSLGIAADGTLTTGRVSSSGLWQGKGQRRPLLLNSPAGKGKFTLYTPVYGTATPRGVRSRRGGDRDACRRPSSTRRSTAP